MVGYVAGPTTSSWTPSLGSLPLSRAFAAARRGVWWIAAALTAAAIFGGLALAQQSEQAMVAERDAAVAAISAQQSALQAASFANTRLEWRLALERIALAALEDDLASTEGFVK